MKVYHGCKSLYGERLFCPIVNYLIKRGKTLDEALYKAEHLYDALIDPVDKFMLQSALNDAQETSMKSPFISTTTSRSMARSFALSSDTKGYIYTIEGPDNLFFDFNKIRLDNNFPPHKTFEWLKELGIPIEVKFPFEIILIEEISDIIEVAEVIYKR